MRDAVLALHVTSGALGLILGLAAMLVERAPRYRSTFGFAFVAAVLVVAISAAGLVAFDPGGLWWLLPLAALAYGLAHLGYQAPCSREAGWVRAYAHGQGGAYIALVTALLVVSFDGPAATLGWVLPTLIGVPMIELRVRAINRGTAAAAAPG